MSGRTPKKAFWMVRRINLAPKGTRVVATRRATRPERPDYKGQFRVTPQPAAAGSKIQNDGFRRPATAEQDVARFGLIQRRLEVTHGAAKQRGFACAADAFAATEGRLKTIAFGELEQRAVAAPVNRASGLAEFDGNCPSAVIIRPRAPLRAPAPRRSTWRCRGGNAAGPCRCADRGWANACWPCPSEPPAG